jgi:tRNA(Ile)-lysidine synthase
MRLIRGTGLYGLISIMPKRKFGSKFLLRPLIEVSKKELAEYLERLKIKPRIDRSNFSRKFLRNRIRHELMEYLRKINPNIKETLARFAQQAAIDYDYLYKHSKKILKDQKGPVIKIGLGSFTKLHTALQRMAIRLALESVSGELRTFTNKHWEEIQDLVESRPTGSIVNLTQKVIVKKDNKYIVVSAQKKEKSIY